MARIVVGVDGSEAAKDALRWALDEARRRQAEVVAVHAWEPRVATPPIAPGGLALPPPDLTTDISAVREAAERLVASEVEEAGADQAHVEVRGVAVEGPAASTLVDAARGADLLVVGSRGHGGFVGMLLGSVSQHVANHAPCPVVIHRHRERDGD